jgi:hypothetical protein
MQIAPRSNPRNTILCACGCGMHKTKRKRKYAPGHPEVKNWAPLAFVSQQPNSGAFGTEDLRNFRTGTPVKQHLKKVK